MKQQEIVFLIEYLLREMGECVPIPEGEDERFRLFRSLVNIRPPKGASDEFLRVQDMFLKEQISRKGITDYRDIVPIEKGIRLWQGDITTLRCGAVVNAANSQMLGCFSPCHGCIDNAIHTFAGVQLRSECALIMERQGAAEPVGGAKMTYAYNLPCDRVIHTVGPAVSGRLTDVHCRQLESCYVSCLERAAENNVASLAFCCISTGVFGFPKAEAAEIAVNTVRKYRDIYNIEVIFNVYSDEDMRIYKGLLGQSGNAGG